MCHRVMQRVSDIVEAGAIPMVFGGDHSIPYPIVRAISDHKQGNIGIINFDVHYDNSWGGRLTEGNQFARIFDTCQAEPENMVLIGIKGGAYNTPNMHEVEEQVGFTIITIDDVEKLGIREVTNCAMEVTARNADRVYVSLDVDAIEPTNFPAQKYPDPFGLTTRQVREAIRILPKKVKIAGFDMVCIEPRYDDMGIDGLTACRFYIEMLNATEARKRLN